MVQLSVIRTQMRQNSILIVLIAFVLSRNRVETLRIEKSVYKDFIVEIGEAVPAHNCLAILSDLRATLTNTSYHLYTALDGLAYFGSISIILPQSWPESCEPQNETVERSSGDPSDLTITPRHHLFGDKAWTLQSGKCGERGDQIYMSYGSLQRPTIAKDLLREWAKYRYGVFDEIGYEADPVYSKCFFTDGQYVTGCSDQKIKDIGFCQNSNQFMDMTKLLDKKALTSIMFVPEAESVLRFCDETNHDRYAPTKHNLLCDRRSVTEVIMKNEDFISINAGGTVPRPSAVDPRPKITYKRRRLTRYVVVIDETQDILVRESWSFLRNAIRKWVVYDLQQNTEIGIVLANDTAADRILGLTGLELPKNRDLVASFVPYAPSDSPQSACITCAVEGALKMLSQRRAAMGAASDVILIIAPGMDFGINYKTLAEWANGNHTRLVTVNFPAVVHRQPLDQLAQLTGGAAFTVQEQKYNSEKSFLNTYFDLTSVLFHISSKYFEGPAAQLPIEIHRKELIDIANDSNSSKRINRVISGNFFMDKEMTTPSGFFIYTHNVELPLIQNVKLTSPGGVTYGTRSDQRMPVKQLTIIASVNQTGPWTYMIDRFNGNPQPHFVQVLATPASYSAAIVTARAWIRKPQSGGPFILYCEVKRGSYPVHAAYVQVSIRRPDLQCNYTNNCVQRFKLLDTGSGDPDITKGDGVYSRYFSAAVSGPGQYRFDILVDDNGNTAYALPDKPDIMAAESPSPGCCGSVISDTMAKQIAPFQRHLPSITLVIGRDEIDEELKTVVGRIGDLTATYLDEGKIRLAWTAPDMGGHSVAKYQVRYALNIFDVVDNFENNAIVWTHDTPYPFSIGDATSFVVNINLEPSLFGSAVFFAIRPYSKLSMDAIPGLISNPVRIFVPVLPKLTTPSDNILGTDHDIELDKSSDDGGQIASANNHSVKMEYSIPIAVGILLVCVIIAIYCIFCVAQRRSKNKNDEKLRKNQQFQQPTKGIDSMPVQHEPPVHPQQRHSPSITQDSSDNFQQIQQLSMQNSLFNYHAIEQPDHHTVGIPIYAESLDLPKKDTDHFAAPTLYATRGTVSIISSSSTNNTLTRQGRILSPYESWTASQLLHEHERRTSPILDDLLQPDHLSLSFDAPPVPPLPYNPDSYQIYATSGGGSVPPSQQQQQQQPPAYSTINRNQVSLQPPQATGPYNNSSIQGSMTSVHSNDKKRRNVTMV